MDRLRDRTTRDILGDGLTTLSADALRHLSSCVILLDTNGQISQVSQGCLRSFDLVSEDETLGRYWWELWPTDAQGPLREAVSRGLRGHITQYWTSFVHADGMVSQWDIRLSPLHDSATQVTSVIAVSRQLTAH